MENIRMQNSFRVILFQLNEKLGKKPLTYKCVLERVGVKEKGKILVEGGMWRHWVLSCVWVPSSSVTTSNPALVTTVCILISVADCTYLFLFSLLCFNNSGYALPSGLYAFYPVSLTFPVSYFCIYIYIYMYMYIYVCMCMYVRIG